MKLEKDIGIWENLLNSTECQGIIDRYEMLETLNLTYSRDQLRDAPAHKKHDKAAFLLGESALRVTTDQEFLHPVLSKFWICYEQYLRHYSVLGETGKHYIRSMKIQKTLPGQGYHLWHYESDCPEFADRICSWAFFLNDVTEGGETEFLYQGLRVPAKAGSLIIWPATYTHVHRGNPPLTETKYLLTGWVEW